MQLLMEITARPNKRLSSYLGSALRYVKARGNEQSRNNQEQT